MIRIFIFGLLFLAADLTAQVTEFSGYDWNTFKDLPDIDTVRQVNGAVITLERRITEVYVNAEEIFEELSIYHRKIRVKTPDAINNFNKIYIPIANSIEILDIKARFISPEGRIIELPKESIKQVENLENKGNFKVFAVEGAEVGGEIEYYYKLKRQFNPYGTYIMQGDEPRTNVEVIYAFPSKLEFLFRSYNGFPEFLSSLDSIKGISYLKAAIKVIPSLEEERYAAYKANLMRYEFTLAYNNFTGSLRVYSFSKASNNIYNNVYALSKSEAASVRTMVRMLKIADLPVEQQIRTIEQWVKSEITVSEELKTTPDVDEMIRLKQTTKSGVARLLVAMLGEAGVDFELVMTCDQENKRFDPDFNGWNFLEDNLIYFPESNKIIIPDNPTYRFGLIPVSYQGSYGLFLHPLNYGEDIHTLAYAVKMLPTDTYLKNSDTLLIRVKVDLNRMNLDANIHRIFTGELAATFQSFWKLTNEKRKDEIVSSVFNMGNENTTITSYSLLFDSPEDIAVNPLVWDVELAAHSLVEQAGEDIIIRIGETIGEQSELYQESIRKLPVYINNLHNYFRKIEFEIPAGYKVSNLENLKMDVEMMHDGRISCCFISDYEIVGNKLMIYSREYYSEVSYARERFGEFRKVINAAADFNKKTILISKM